MTICISSQVLAAVSNKNIFHMLQLYVDGIQKGAKVPNAMVVALDEPTAEWCKVLHVHGMHQLHVHGMHQLHVHCMCTPCALHVHVHCARHVRCIDLLVLSSLSCRRATSRTTPRYSRRAPAPPTTTPPRDSSSRRRAYYS